MLLRNSFHIRQIVAIAVLEFTKNIPHNAGLR